MWNQPSGGSIGSLLQNLAQNNPQVFQAIMQMVSAQRQQGVGGIGSLMPRAGMSPRGDNSMIGGPMPMPAPTYRRGPDGTTLDTLSLPGMSGGMRPADPNAAWQQARNWMQPAGGGSVPGMSGAGTPSYGGFLGGPNQWYMAPAEGSAPYTPPPYVSPMPGWPTPRQGGAATGVGGVGSGSVRSDQGARPAPPYRAPAYTPPQPTGPKYMPPSGPKTYGQTMPAEAPASFAQPKPFPQPAAQPSLAGDGTTGLDWYAMQAGN